ncbi:MAG: hypothetical protein R2793_07335 [Flavobacteriaceae bacterium]
MKTKVPMGRGMMLFFLLSCFTFGNLTSMRAQQHFEDCGADYVNDLNGTITVTPPYSGSIDPAYLETFEPIVFNIFFWQVNDPNGQFDNPLTQYDVLTAVANLNKAYNDFNVFFKYRGFDTLDSAPNQPEYTGSGGADCQVLPQQDPEGFSDLHICEFQYLLNYAKSIDKWKDNAFNIYVANSSPSFRGVTTYFKSEAYITQPNLTTPVLLHEIGHCFHLPHTFNNFDDAVTCEHVTRDPSLICDPSHPEIPCFNALTRGDFVLDTAAAPNFKREWCYANGLPIDCEGNQDYYYINNCAYVGASNDCQGTLYDIQPSDVQNYMAYIPDGCWNNFSIGQKIRIREAIIRDSQGNFVPTIDAVSSLYEPYAGEYYGRAPPRST